MNRVAILFALLGMTACSDKCADLKASADGVPAEYYQEKCQAEQAFRKGEYMSAAKHYEKASSVGIYEAPNYELRFEWAQSLCLSGEKKRGRDVIQSFVLMAKADLGEIPCPEGIERSSVPEHIELACEGYGSGLSKQGARELKEKLLRVGEISEICKDA